ncbi:MAG: 23S rRNA (guanosine(2251)-2'-O)-methyltransferase RlmB [Chitinophagales bacterium]|nr:23S rRNA (guanosine(2251)-2'-O)-methyltransferase RlmB [Chitinophagales bacterium]
MKKKDVFIGRQPALELLKSDQSVEKILIQKGATGDEINEIRKICEERSIPVQFVPKEKINYLLYQLYQNEKANHQGVVGYYGAINYYKLDDVYNQVLSNGEMALFLVLDGVTDVRNFGAIARTAEAMGVHAIVVPEKGSAQINQDAMKASAGALHNVKVCKVKDLQQAFEFFNLNGIQISASTLQTDILLENIDFTLPSAVVLGSEGFGISKQSVQAADNLFIIPMFGEINSLNVSVSAGVILYEISKQRNSVN